MESIISLNGLETRSILSEISGIELPSDEKSMNLILRKAVETMRKYVQRGKSAAKQGVRATYKVKVGQKRSRRREQELAWKRTMEEQKGLINSQNGSRKSPPLVPEAQAVRLWLHQQNQRSTWLTYLT